MSLYWARDPSAIDLTSAKYGAYCAAIASNILSSAEDAEECVSDTWLRAWSSIPPQRPNILRAYLGRITRNLSVDRYRQNRAEKRGGELPLVLHELEDCVSGAESVDAELSRRALVEAIDAFLDTLPKRRRVIFLLRCWHACPVAEIARRLGMTEGSVSAALSRTRSGLRAYLTERGFEL